jgi:HEAT repeat protein
MNELKEAVKANNIEELDLELLSRAVMLCKSNVRIEKVSEFPKLQNIMVDYYNLNDKEKELVDSAIRRSLYTNQSVWRGENNLTNQAVIDLIKPLLKDDVFIYARESVSQVFGGFFKAMTAKDALEQITSLLKDNDIRYSVMKILQYVLDVDQTFVNKELLEQIIPLLKDNKWSVRDSAIEVLGSILQCDPNLANKELLEQIIPLLEDDEYYVRDSANYITGLINGIMINKGK